MSQNQNIFLTITSKIVIIKDIRIKDLIYACFPCSKGHEQCFNFLNPGSNGENIIFWNFSTKKAENDISNLQQGMSDEVRQEFCAKRGHGD